MTYVPGLYGMSNAYSNSWQWDMQSSAPNDMLGALNDINLFQNGAQVGRTVDSAAYLSMKVPPMLENFSANLAKVWQEMIMKISSGKPNINIIDTTTTDNTKKDSKLEEGKIISTLEKMGSGLAVSDRINQEITIKDKDGNDVKTTILRRLIGLCDEYRKDPKGAEITKENYEKIWEIAGKYAKTGDVSSEDFAILREIALNPGGKKDDDDDDATEPVTTPLSDIAEAKKNSEAYKTEVNNTATEFKDALFGWGTKYDHLDTAINSINAENIVEVFDKYYTKYGIGEGETLVESIYNDFDNWTNTWYGATGSAPTFTAIHDALVERAQNHITKYGDTEDKKLQAALDNFNTRFEGINQDNYGEKKAELKSMFADIIKAIKEAETNTINKEKADKKADDDKKSKKTK